MAVVKSPEALHPGFQIFVDEIAKLQATGAPAWHQLSALQLRALTQDIRKGADPVKGIERRDLQLAGAEGLISARLYVPAGIEKCSAGLVYFHGGGFAIGSVDTHDSIVANLARSSGIRILSVDYRLSRDCWLDQRMLV